MTRDELSTVFQALAFAAVRHRDQRRHFGQASLAKLLAAISLALMPARVFD